jgi:hypothetical protein
MDSLSSANSTTSAAPTPAAPPERHHFSEKWLAVLILLLVVTFPIIAGVLKYVGTPASPQRPPTGLRLHGISMISPDEGWIVGDKPRSNPEKDRFGAIDMNAVEPIILHYKAGHWTQDQLPSNINPYHLDMTLSNIAMVSATEGWATGSTLLPAYHNTIVDGITFPVLLHYTGGKWTLVENPPVDLGSMVIHTARDGWAIGYSRDPDPSGPLALRYNGTTWTAIKDPAFASLSLNTLAKPPTARSGLQPLIIANPALTEMLRRPSCITTAGRGHASRSTSPMTGSAGWRWFRHARAGPSATTPAARAGTTGGRSMASSCIITTASGRCKALLPARLVIPSSISRRWQ